MSKCGNCYYGIMTGPNRMFCSAQNCLCEEVFDCEDYDPIVKPQTNANRIRSMSDEELAEFIASGVPMGVCKDRCGGDESFQCSECVLDWLKQEAEGSK